MLLLWEHKNSLWTSHFVQHLEKLLGVFWREKIKRPWPRYEKCESLQFSDMYCGHDRGNKKPEWFRTIAACACPSYVNQDWKDLKNWYGNRLDSLEDTSTNTHSVKASSHVQSFNRVQKRILIFISMKFVCIRWNRMYRVLKDVYSTGQLPLLRCLLWPHRSISERFVTFWFKHWPAASQTKIMNYRSDTLGLSVCSSVSFTLWPLEAITEPDWRARNFEQLGEEDLTASVITYLETREVWGSLCGDN